MQPSREPVQSISNAACAEVMEQAQILMPELLTGNFVAPWHTNFNADSEVDEVLFEALLPSFVTEGVRDIQACIQQLHLQLASSKKELSSHEQRLDIISEHLKVGIQCISDHTGQSQGVLTTVTSPPTNAQAEWYAGRLCPLHIPQTYKLRFMWLCYT